VDDFKPGNKATANVRDDSSCVEKFTQSDLLALRNDLLQSGVDSFRAAEIVTNFLSGRGYGVCSDEARRISSKLELFRASTESMQEQLESVARVM
jgi:hypothetical protein